MKKRKICFICFLCLCFLLAFTGCAAPASEEIDYLHYEDGNFSINVTAPESWPESASPLSVHYDPLDETLLEASLTPPVERTETDNHEEEEGEEEYVFLRIGLAGTNGASWLYWVDPLQHFYNYYYYCSDSNETYLNYAGQETDGEDEAAQTSCAAAETFLEQIGIADPVLEHCETLTELSGVYRLYYTYWEGDLPTRSYQVFLSNGGAIEVIAGESGVLYAEIYSPNQITGVLEAQTLLSPTEAAEALAQWHEDNPDRAYSLTELDLRYYTDSVETTASEDHNTGTARPVWAFCQTAEDETAWEGLLVDAIDGTVY